mgnify:FL=1
MKSATYSYSDAFTTGKLALGFSRANLSQDTLFSADHNMPQDLSFLRGVRSDGGARNRKSVLPHFQLTDCRQRRPAPAGSSCRPMMQ